MRIRRWFVYRDAGTLLIERGPDPDCADCNGQGAWMTACATDPEEPEFISCPCSIGPAFRIRYRPRRKSAPATDPWLRDEPPF
ncbi:hypothetical protein [Yinghuangia sp. YIM S10712]|uniref:hypothetical protein n=1 Tax=Yinghuangia sp. YIM S10712 TaxID=3436930 RepID=UPI003F52BF9A